MRDLPAIFHALSEQLGSDGDRDARTLADVRRFVADRVAGLLDGNPGLLMSILYRIDVAEDRVQAVLQHVPYDAIPEALAELIVARQVEKMQLRRRYRTLDRT